MSGAFTQPAVPIAPSGRLERSPVATSSGAAARRAGRADFLTANACDGLDLSLASMAGRETWEAEEAAAGHARRSQETLMQHLGNLPPGQHQEAMKRVEKALSFDSEVARVRQEITRDDPWLTADEAEARASESVLSGMLPDLDPDQRQRLLADLGDPDIAESSRMELLGLSLAQYAEDESNRSTTIPPGGSVRNSLLNAGWNDQDIQDYGLEGYVAEQNGLADAGLARPGLTLRIPTPEAFMMDDLYAAAADFAGKSAALSQATLASREAARPVHS
ncbi:MAG: hypothetical protein AB1758_30125 [Candidatus Eremiobacterota bacterium]